MNMLNDQIKRVFSFGCSFTGYFWGCTWPEIIAADLDVPLFNYGKSGAGNQYMANLITQTDAIYKFDTNDFIGVCWTNVCREDRWARGNWVCPGNIFTQGEYDDSFVKKWSDPVGYMIRDLSTIKLTKSFIETKTENYSFLSMCDIVEQIDQSSNKTIDPRFSFIVQKLLTAYKEDLDSIKSSFFKILWNNDVYRNKLLPEKNTLGDLFSDGHPSPSEHLMYLKKVFPDHQFKEKTEDAVKNSQLNLENFIQRMNQKYKKQYAVYQLSRDEQVELKEITTIKKSQPDYLF